MLGWIKGMWNRAMIAAAKKCLSEKSQTCAQLYAEIAMRTDMEYVRCLREGRDTSRFLEECLAIHDAVVLDIEQMEGARDSMEAIAWCETEGISESVRQSRLELHGYAARV